MGFTIDITGDISQKVDEIEETVKQVLRDELADFGFKVVADASALCPVDLGKLRQSIIAVELPPPAIGVQIIAAVNYAAYVEFGTGVFAAAYVPGLPQEVQEYARSFFVTGKGRLPARPFLFPAIEKNLVELKNRLKSELNA